MDRFLVCSGSGWLAGFAFGFSLAMFIASRQRIKQIDKHQETLGSIKASFDAYCRSIGVRF